MFSTIIRVTTYLMIGLSPFINLLNLQVHGLAGIKEIYQLLIIIIFLLVLILNRKLYLASILIPLYLYVMAFFASGVNTPDVNLYMDGLRFQLGYVIVCILIIMSGFKFDIRVIRKIISFVYLLSLVVGSIEFFDPVVIETLYGIKKEDLPNTKLAVGFRLISIFSNPINYSIFLCIGYLCFYFEFIRFKKILILLGLLTAINIALTFSRAGLLIFCSILIFINLVNLKRVFWVGLILIPVFGLLSVFSLDENDALKGIAERNSSLVDVTTFTENDRVRNWEEAFAKNSAKELIVGNGLGSSNSDRSTAGTLIENSFLSIFFDLGIIGFFSFLVFLVYLLSNCLISKNKSFYLLFFFVFFAFGVGNDIHKNFPFVFYFWLICGCLINEKFADDRYIDCK